MPKYAVPAPAINLPPEFLEPIMDFVPFTDGWLYGFICRQWHWFNNDKDNLINGMFYDAVMELIDEELGEDEEPYYKYKAEAAIEEYSDDIVTHLRSVHRQMAPYVAPFLRKDYGEDLKVVLDAIQGDLLIIDIKEITRGRSVRHRSRSKSLI